MKTDLPAALPPRARRALLAFGIRTAAEAAGLSDEELMRIKGVGRAAVEVIRSAGGPPQGVTASKPAGDAGDAGDLGDLVGGGRYENTLAEGRRIDAAVAQLKASPLLPTLAVLARDFVHLLSERCGLSPSVVAAAWDAALAFEQEARRTAGVDLELHDGLKVRFNGRVCEVRLSPPPAGTEHKTVALVPVAER